MFRSIIRRLGTSQFAQKFTVSAAVFNKNKIDLSDEKIRKIASVINKLTIDRQTTEKTFKTPQLKNGLFQGVQYLRQNDLRIEDLPLSDIGRSVVLEISKNIEQKQKEERQAVMKQKSVLEGKFDHNLVIDKNVVDVFGPEKIAAFYFTSDEKVRKNIMRKVCSRNNDYEIFRSFIAEDTCRKLLTCLIRDNIHFNKRRENREIKRHAKQLDDIYGGVFKYIARTEILHSDRNMIRFLLESESHAEFVIKNGVRSRNHAKILFKDLISSEFIFKESDNKITDYSKGRSLRLLIGNHGAECGNELLMLFSQLHKKVMKTQPLLVSECLQDEKNNRTSILKHVSIGNILPMLKNAYLCRILEVVFENTTYENVEKFFGSNPVFIQALISDEYGAHYITYFLKSEKAKKNISQKLANDILFDVIVSDLQIGDIVSETVAPVIDHVLEHLGQQNINKFWSKFKPIFEDHAEIIMKSKTGAHVVQKCIPKMSRAEVQKTIFPILMKMIRSNGLMILISETHGPVIYATVGKLDSHPVHEFWMEAKQIFLENVDVILKSRTGAHVIYNFTLKISNNEVEQTIFPVLMKIIQSNYKFILTSETHGPVIQAALEKLDNEQVFNLWKLVEPTFKKGSDFILNSKSGVHVIQKFISNP